jgi:pyruvate-ferredoxin/flavodoxin oxidoreductase
MKVYAPEDAPASLPSKAFRSRDLPGHLLTIQVSPDDCTGCGVCVQVCPAAAKDGSGHKSIDMLPAAEHRERELAGWEQFSAIPPLDRSLLPHDSVKGSQVLEPLFEFSGAGAGCGETPYLKLLSQLFGDRAMIANATGCSSIFGGNLPTTPWSVNAAGRGPAWANSLFEDNAEFGLGIRVALDAHAEAATALLERLAPVVGEDLARSILDADQSDEPGIDAQRERIAELRRRLAERADDAGAGGRHLDTVADELVQRSLWIVGGDGWAYDIGSGGLDHVLASGRNVNVLVLDTEVYSNTGGQASKATPRGASAKFAASGKPGAKKDLGLVATSYGNVYVAQVALGGSDVQTVKALLEADAWPGPSLVIAYCSCAAAHGFDESQSMAHEKLAVRSGHWPLFRFHPGEDAHEHPFTLDSHEPAVPLREFAMGENRFAALARQDEHRSDELLAAAQVDVDERWRLYQQLAAVERTMPHPTDEADGD